jgi:methionyl aminopeptidase
MTISIKDAQGADGMRVAGRLASEVLDYLTPFVQPGVTTNELDKLAHDYMVNVQGCIPCPPELPTAWLRALSQSRSAPPSTTRCVMASPTTKPSRKGDIVNIDITVIKDGWHGDTSRMFYVGEASIAAKRLCTVTYEAMWHGIAQVKPGARLGDIGWAIQKFAENLGFSIVREFCGHGIGQVFHEEPQVLHYGKPGTLEELKAGMTFTIEPMINAGKRDIKEMGDGWTIVTKDRSLVRPVGTHHLGH